MHRIRLAWLLLLMPVPMLAGCFRSSGDEPDFPEPISESVCPDLSGSFRYQADPHSQGAWTDIIRYRIDLGGPATAVSLFDRPDGPGLTFVLHREPAEFARAVSDFRAQQPAAYEEWRRQALALFDPLRAALKVRRELPFDALKRHGPVPEWGVHDSKGRCVDGWYRDTRPYDAEVWLTRDVEGGLLVRLDKTERKVIGVWAETGAGIPYAIHTRSRWARFARVEIPDDWRPTAASLPPLAGAAPAGEATGSMKKEEDPRVSDLRWRARKLMGPDSMLVNFKAAADHVRFTGTLPDRAALDRFVAEIGKHPAVAKVELESTTDISFGQVRFAMRLSLRPK